MFISILYMWIKRPGLDTEQLLRSTAGLRIISAVSLCLGGAHMTMLL